MSQSIQRDLRLRLVAGMLLLTAAAGAALYLYVRVALQSQFDRALASKADAIALLVEQRRDGNLEFEFSPASMPEFGPTATGDFFEIRREDGRLFAASPSLRGRTLVAPPAMRTGRALDVTLPTGNAGRGFWLRFRARAEVNEDGTPDSQNRGPAMSLFLARDRAEIDRPLYLLLTGLFAIAGALALGTVALVSVTLRRGLQPLRTLAADAAAINAETLVFRFPTEGLPEELHPICRRLNDLLGRLQDAFTRERRFTSDAAHELRTPIAELRALAEVALRRGGDAHDAERDASDALAIARQMESLVSALLALARCQAGALTISPQTINLSQAVQEAWRPLAAESERRRLAVRFDLLPALLYRTDPTFFGSILANLLANAVAYAPASTTIDCRVAAVNAGFELTIANASAGLAREDLPHLFEPFCRKDASRSDGRHSGLGLALVAAYARLLGIQVNAQLPTPDRFEIILTGRTDAD